MDDGTAAVLSDVVCRARRRMHKRPREARSPFDNMVQDGCDQQMRKGDGPKYKGGAPPI